MDIKGYNSSTVSMHLVHVVHAPCTWCMCMCIRSMCMVHAHICAACKWCTCIRRTVHKLHAHIAYAAPTYREFRVFFGLSLGSIWGQSGIILGSIWDHVGFNAPAKKKNERRAFSGEKTNEKHTKLLYIYICTHLHGRKTLRILFGSSAIVFRPSDLVLFLQPWPQ
jgi:hypothetical protein